MSSQPGRRRRLFILSCVMAVALLGLHLSQEILAQEPETRAIVVEAVEKGWAGHKAGILPGDVFTSWKRAASPPANPSADQGDLVSPFDLAEIEVEHAPRGTVTLLGSRGAQRLAIVVPAGRWRITGRPAMSARMSELYTSGRALATAGKIDEAVAAWRSAAGDAARADGGGPTRRGCCFRRRWLCEARTGWPTHTLRFGGPRVRGTLARPSHDRRPARGRGPDVRNAEGFRQGRSNRIAR